MQQFYGRVLNDLPLLQGALLYNPIKGKHLEVVLCLSICVTSYFFLEILRQVRFVTFRASVGRFETVFLECQSNSHVFNQFNVLAIELIIEEARPKCRKI